MSKNYYVPIRNKTNYDNYKTNVYKNIKEVKNIQIDSLGFISINFIKEIFLNIKYLIKNIRNYKTLTLFVSILLLVVILFYRLFLKELYFYDPRFNNPWVDTYYSTLKAPIDTSFNYEFGSKVATGIQPEISGVSALVIEKDTGNILFEKNSKDVLPIASLVKVMTAVLVLEHGDLDSKHIISSKSASIGENSMGLSEGEVFTQEELLYGLLLNSGNDAAYALSEAVANDSDIFVKWMNKKSYDLGMKDTIFYDPSGLDDRSRSSVSDLAILTVYAMKNPGFRKIVATFSMEYPSDENHKYIYLENQTNLLTTYPGVIGVKTGYTQEAGLCLITYSSNEGHDLVGVVLGSPDRKGDMILMLDHSFRSLGIEIEHNLLE